jgi:hypothetical protein
MGDQYIKNLVANLRSPEVESSPPKEALALKKDLPEKEELKEKKVRQNKNKSRQSIKDLSPAMKLIMEIQASKTEGGRKRLIRISEKNDELLKLLTPIFKLEVTAFVNYLCTQFFEQHPELIQEIKLQLKSITP